MKIYYLLNEKMEFSRAQSLKNSMVEFTFAFNQFTEIALSLDKHPTTIAKEVRKHRVADSKFKPHDNDCLDKTRCKIKGLNLSPEQLYKLDSQFLR